MPSLYALKPGFQALLRPLVGGLARVGVTPNAVTLGSLGICAGYGAFLTFSGSRTAFLFLPAILALRMALNAIDGMLAREHGNASILGARLNEFSDVASDLCLYLPFMALVTPPGLVLLVVITGILAEFAGVLSCAHGCERNYDGPFGKSDRAAFFSAIAVAMYLAKLSGAIIAALFLMAAIGGVVTIFNRLMRGASPC